MRDTSGSWPKRKRTSTMPKGSTQHGWRQDGSTKDFDGYYAANFKRRSAEILSAGLMAGKRVEAINAKQRGELQSTVSVYLRNQVFGGRQGGQGQARRRPLRENKITQAAVGSKTSGCTGGLRFSRKRQASNTIS